MADDTCPATVQCGGRTIACNLAPHATGKHRGDWDGCPCGWPRDVDEYGRPLKEATQKAKVARD
jgi:hypothetical protein